MSKQKVTVEVEIPDGWEATGEFRKPEPGDTALAVRPAYTGKPFPKTENFLEGARHFIIRRKETDAVKLARECLVAHRYTTHPCGCTWCKLAVQVIADFEKNGGGA